MEEQCFFFTKYGSFSAILPFCELERKRQTITNNSSLYFGGKTCLAEVICIFRDNFRGTKIELGVSKGFIWVYAVD